MSIAVQKQIKDNSTSVRDFFTDIYNWTAEQEKEEKRRVVRNAARKGDQLGVAAAVGALSSEAKQKPDETLLAKKDGIGDSKGEDAIARDKLPMPQYYNQWDQYDVDGELDKIEDEAFEQQKAERESRQAEKDRILDGMSINGEGDRSRTTKARPRVKISVRTSGRRAAPVDLALPKKEEANRYFKEGRHREAIQLYSSALDLLEKYEPPERSAPSHENRENGHQPQDNKQAGDCLGDESQAIALKATLLANRAAVLCKMEEWREAAMDATEALRFDPSHHKSLLRRGTAMVRMKRWGCAAKDLERVVAVDPDDAKAQRDLKMARRMLVEQLKESRAHAKVAMCDPTRNPVMPTRRLKVRALQPNAAKASAKIIEDDVAEISTARTPLIKPTVAREQACDHDVSGGDSNGTAVPTSAPARPAYVPRSVRMRGRTPAATSEPVATSRTDEGGADAEDITRGSGSRATSSTAVGEPATMNFYTFEGQWSRFRKDPAKRFDLLRRIGARGLPALFRESLDAELMSSIFEVLLSMIHETPAAAAFSADVLEALANTSRVDLSLAGLSSAEWGICNELLACLEVDSSCCERKRLDGLRSTYTPRLAASVSLDDMDDTAEEPTHETTESTLLVLGESSCGTGDIAEDDPGTVTSADFALDGCD